MCRWLWRGIVCPVCRWVLLTRRCFCLLRMWQRLPPNIFVYFDLGLLYRCNLLDTSPVHQQFCRTEQLDFDSLQDFSYKHAGNHANFKDRSFLNRWFHLDIPLRYQHTYRAVHKRDIPKVSFIRSIRRRDTILRRSGFVCYPPTFNLHFFVPLLEN